MSSSPLIGQGKELKLTHWSNIAKTKSNIVITSSERRQFDPVYPELSRASSSNLTRILVMSCTNIQQTFDVRTHFPPHLYWRSRQIIQQSRNLSLHFTGCCCVCAVAAWSEPLATHITMSHPESEQQPRSRTDPVPVSLPINVMVTGPGWLKLGKSSLFAIICEDTDLILSLV